MSAKPCPNCGKPMIEQPRFKGLWTCPDYAKPINDAPPYQYKCIGMELTEEGEEAFDEEMMRLSLERSKRVN